MHDSDSLPQMTFSGFIPDWWCQLNQTSSEGHAKSLMTSMTYVGRGASTSMMSSSVFTDYMVEEGDVYCNTSNELFELCSLPSKYTDTACGSYCFDSKYKTIITEFDLVCDLHWVKQLVISIQMTGTFFGALVSGQIGDTWGRKKTFYGFLFLHGLAHLAAGFSISWIMYAVCLFFTGFSAGGHLVVIFPYSLEFFTKNWRTLTSFIPKYQIGVAIYVGFIYIFNDWSNLHFGCAVFNTPFIFGWFYFPESPRWLAAHGRVDEAVKAVEKIARANGKDVPPEVKRILQDVSGPASDSDIGQKKYTYLDLFRSRKSAVNTVCLCVMWIALQASLYGIAYGISRSEPNSDL